MNIGSQSGLTPLPVSLKSHLDLIIQKVHHFWENSPHYPHFTNTNLTHSERIHRLLAQLAQELPLSRQLGADEVFIVSAAAYLYEIGLQNPNLRPVLDFDCPPGTLPSQQQLLEIRQKKHLLSQRLIIESVRNEYRGFSLGLSADDDYTHLIADVCRWISDEPLADVPEMLPVHGIPVRVRLLVALLRLADQLYIDSARVNLDLLMRAGIPEQQFARWSAYHYTQILPIDKGQIRFHYFLPFDQREYLGHIRALIEPDFEFDKNSTVRWLWDEYGLRLMPSHNPSLTRYDQSASFQRPMSDEMIAFLRQEVQPILTPAASQPESVVGDPEACLLVLDFENFIIQLGLEGYFLSLEQISHYVAQLQGNAIREHDGTIQGLAVGHWNRADLVDAAKMLKKWVYDLINIESDEDPAEKLSSVLMTRAHSDNPPKRTILIAPRPEMGRTVLNLKQAKQIVSTWITGVPDAEIFRGGFGNKYNLLSEMLSLGTPQPLDQVEFESCEASCILRLQSVMVDSKIGYSLTKIRECLEQIERLSGQFGWWQSWLLHTGILVADSATSKTFRLNNNHPSIVRVSQMRITVVETLAKLSSDSQGVSQDKLLKELRLRESTLFRQDSSTIKFLELLKDEELIRRDANPWLETQPSWKVNTDHRNYVSLDAERYLASFAVAFDHVALRDGHFKLYEHSLLRIINPYIGENSVEAVYGLAQKEGWVQRKETDEKLHRGKGNLVIVRLNESNPGVGRALRNRNILVNYLNGRNAKEGLDRKILWQRLKQIRSFDLDEEGFSLLIDILERDSLVTIVRNVANLSNDHININKQAPLTQKLFGRMHLYGLIRILRQLRASNPDNKRSVQEVMDPLMRFVTSDNEDMARWVLNYALSIGLIETSEGKNQSTENITSLWLTHHPFVGRLDDREGQTCKLLGDLVRSLARSSRDGWVPQAVIFTEMDKSLLFGYSREEQEYWMFQVIYPLKILEMRQDNIRDRVVLFVRVKIDAKVQSYAEKQIILPIQKEELTPESHGFLQEKLPTSSNPEYIIQIFLSYAHVDFSSVMDIYERLSSIIDFQPWMDKKNLLGGEKWRESIEKAIKKSDFFLVCLTKNSMKKGFLQNEIKIALEICKEMPENEIFLIPVRLEDCYVPEALREIHWVNLYESDGWYHLERSIRRAYQIRKNAL